VAHALSGLLTCCGELQFTIGGFPRTAGLNRQQHDKSCATSATLHCYPETVKMHRFIGRPLDSLSLAERWGIAGSWIALELYTPQTVPLRIIEAIAPTAQGCIEQLRRRGLNPERYEFCPCPQPYHP
jgi:hypothetical protein